MQHTDIKPEWIDRFADEVVRLFPSLGRARAVTIAKARRSSDAQPPEVAATLYLTETMLRILGPRPKLAGWGTARRSSRLRRTRRGRRA
jgi:hypothetical protein